MARRKPPVAQVAFKLEREVLDRIDAWSAGRGITNRGDALATLVVAGLERADAGDGFTFLLHLSAS